MSLHFCSFSYILNLSIPTPITVPDASLSESPSGVCSCVRWVGDRRAEGQPPKGGDVRWRGRRGKKLSWEVAKHHGLDLGAKSQPCISPRDRQGLGGPLGAVAHPPASGSPPRWSASAGGTSGQRRSPGSWLRPRPAVPHSCPSAPCRSPLRL